MQYFAEFLVGIECVMVLATLVYLCEYGKYYLTATEDVEAHSSRLMKKGVHRWSTDLNDSIIRSDMYVNHGLCCIFRGL